MARLNQLSHQRSQALLAVSLVTIALGSVLIVFAIYRDMWPIVQFAFATVSLAFAIAIQVSSHDETVKRAILVICGFFAPIWFIATGILWLSG
jgi:hypothetical protein